MGAKRGPGRPTEKPLTAFIKARCTQAQHDKFIVLGGGDWLRKQIDAATINERQVTNQ